MSILIKGMEMPKDGTYSIVHIYSDGHVSMPFWGKGMQIVSWITAVPIPSHGDLIDRDALEYHADNVRDPMGRTEKTVMWKKIKAAPAIIPADKDGDNNG